MSFVDGVYRDALLLTINRRRCLLTRTMAGQAEVVERGLSMRLKTALADARPALRRIAERWCGNSGDAEDLLQDTFERALLRGIPPEIRCIVAWLTTMMHHLFINRCRDAARKPNHEALADNHGDVTRLEPDAPEPAWDHITVQDIRDALDHIEPVYRDVYRLHTFEYLSYKQIARQLSIDRITVGTRLHRARKQLREVLVKRFGLEGEP
jgi:RNA polymerase sigma-70 factor, ECF subfamily